MMLAEWNDDVASSSMLVNCAWKAVDAFTVPSVPVSQGFRSVMQANRESRRNPKASEGSILRRRPLGVISRMGELMAVHAGANSLTFVIIRLFISLFGHNRALANARCIVTRSFRSPLS